MFKSNAKSLLITRTLPVLFDRIAIFRAAVRSSARVLPSTTPIGLALLYAVAVYRIALILVVEG